MEERWYTFIFTTACFVTLLIKGTMIAYFLGEAIPPYSKQNNQVMDLKMYC
jgi:hypothetical protein